MNYKKHEKMRKKQQELRVSTLSEFLDASERDALFETMPPRDRYFMRIYNNYFTKWLKEIKKVDVKYKKDSAVLRISEKQIRAHSLEFLTRHAPSIFKKHEPELYEEFLFFFNAHRETLIRRELS